MTVPLPRIPSSWRVTVHDENGEQAAVVFIVATSSVDAENRVEGILSDFHHVDSVTMYGDVTRLTSPGFSPGFMR